VVANALGSRARQATYRGNRTIVVADGSVTAPGPGQVRVDVAYTGICGTDLHILHGAMDQRVTTPAVIGHEMSGRVAELGPGVVDWAIGDPVTVMPLDWCGECPACQRGHSHICQRLNFLGIDSSGSMQSSWTVPSHVLVRLPTDVPLELAALVEPTAVAVHDVRRGGVTAGERVVVVGGGPVGILVALAARVVGADVVVLELDEHRRGIAASLGLTVMNPRSPDFMAAIYEWTGGAGADVAFEVSGSAGGVTTATHTLGVRGRLVMVAIHSTPREVDLFRLFWRELSVIGARVYERQDFEAAVRLVSTEDIPVRGLISRVVPIGEAAEAFAALEQGGAMKILVDCQGG
jgi:(R,R)-butanediol dehydrogenase / meso-butanediol dehydrogenase / diacetyl reductase